MMLALLRRARRLSAREWADLVRAQMAILHAECAVRTRSRGRLLAYDGAAGSPAGRPAGTARAEQLAWALTRVAEHGLLRPRCLSRSVALQRLLTRAGIPGSRIRIGVRPDAERLTAHAWVTLDGRVLGDDPGFVARFTEIADARAVDFA